MPRYPPPVIRNSDTGNDPNASTSEAANPTALRPCGLGRGAAASRGGSPRAAPKAGTTHLTETFPRRTRGRRRPEHTDRAGRRHIRRQHVVSIRFLRLQYCHGLNCVTPKCVSGSPSLRRGCVWDRASGRQVTDKVLQVGPQSGEAPDGRGRSTSLLRRSVWTCSAWRDQVATQQGGRLRAWKRNLSRHPRAAAP